MDAYTLLAALEGTYSDFHGYPWLIHRLAYRFEGHKNLHVRDYKERGNINNSLELAILRFHLVIDASTAPTGQKSPIGSGRTDESCPAQFEVIGR